MELVEFPVPDELAANEVLIKVFATTATYFCCVILHGNFGVPLPCTTGDDMVGIVLKVGKDVKTVSVGDRVAAMPVMPGTYTTHRVLPEVQVIKIRSDVEPEKAVTAVLTGMTAYGLLHHATAGRIKPTSKILVHSCGGGTGTTLVQLALIAGIPAANIFGTCSEKSLSTVRSELRIRTFDYKKDDWSKGVLEASNGEGVDVVFDAVMLGSYMSSGFACLKRGGKYVAYGFTNSAAPGIMNIPSIMLVFTRMAIQQNLLSWFDGREASFFNVGTHREKQKDQFASDLRTVIDYIQEGKFRPIIGKVWQFEEAVQALQSIEQKTHIGKQVITVAKP